MNQVNKNNLTPGSMALPWTDALALDVALMLEGSCGSMEDIYEHHNIDRAGILEISRDPIFLARVKDNRREISENGKSFRLKARTQAEAMLDLNWILVNDPMTSPAVRADIIKQTVRWAGYEPKSGVGDAGGGGGSVRISINLNGDNKELTNAQAPVVISQGEDDGA